MLDMGFEPQIQKIVARMPRQRQTLFYSATWPKEVKSIASQFVVNQTVHVFIGGVDDRLVANKAITQTVEIVNGMDKVLNAAETVLLPRLRSRTSRLGLGSALHPLPPATRTSILLTDCVNPLPGHLLGRWAR